VIKSEIVKIENYKGVSGITSFDEDGNVMESHFMVKTIKNNNFKLYE